MKIKIQSITDLITNSSTETFTVLNDNAECIIRNIVDSLLASVGSTLMFSDLFVFDTKFDEIYEGAIDRSFSVASFGTPEGFNFYNEEITIKNSVSYQ